MDSNLRDKARRGEVTRRDRERAGLPLRLSDLTEGEREAKRKARLSRVWEYLWNEGEPRLEGLDWLDGVAGETDEQTLVADWSGEYRVHEGGVWRDTTPQERERDLGPRAERVLERLAVNLDWHDQILHCDCGKGFRTQPDSFWFVMYGWIGDGDYCCGDCVGDDPSDYFAACRSDGSYLGRQRVDTRMVDPADHGWYLLADHDGHYKAWEETDKLASEVLARFDGVEVMCSENSVWTSEPLDEADARECCEAVYCYSGWTLAVAYGGGLVHG